jgi:23S rRNA (adenine2030-N6)-methyltransferase
MNYRHAFHAGNFGDVLKHAAIALIVEHLKQKDAAFRVIDTHAGVGLYDLSADEAERTGEWRDGIGRVLDAASPPEVARLIAPWLDVVRAENGGGPLLVYPGSPILVRRLLRRQDRLTAVELHPLDARALGHLFAGDWQVRVAALDGWLALKAFVPPKERRGLVIVDPPFEEADEFRRLADGILEAWRRWPTGSYLGWYPIKSLADVEALHARLAGSGIAKLLAADLLVRDAAGADRLPGAGIVVVNPPWTLAEDLEALLPWLARTLAQGPGARGRVARLKEA